MTRRIVPAAALVLAALFGSSCNGSSSNSNSPPYNPEIPTEWAAVVTNSYFPLTPGTVYEFAGGGETGRTEVLPTTRLIQGVTATEVRDQVFVNAELAEETLDFYAQDAEGNVWYLGEESKEYENGVVVSTDGSWEWGVSGALPGVLMWADPAAHIGVDYRQEYKRDEAEDWGRVDALNQMVDVTYGHFTDVLRTYDYSGIESNSGERKFYAPGIGLVREESVSGGTVSQLVQVTGP
jgi:hypothetical protein